MDAWIDGWIKREMDMCVSKFLAYVFVCKLFKAVGKLGATRGKRKFLWFVEHFLL